MERKTASVATGSDNRRGKEFLVELLLSIFELSLRRVRALQGFVEGHTGCYAGDDDCNQQEAAAACPQRRSAAARARALRSLSCSLGGVIGIRIKNHAVGHSFGHKLCFIFNRNRQRSAIAA